MKERGYIFIFEKLYAHFSKKRKFQLLFLLFTIVLATFLEIVQLALFLPLLNRLLSPEKSETASSEFIFNILSVTDRNKQVVLLALIFSIVTLASGGVRLFSLWLSSRLSLVLGTELGSKMYNNVLNQPFEFHLNRPSNQIISILTDRVNHTVLWVVLPTLNLISSAILILAITATLVVVNPKIALASVLLISLAYLFITRFSKRFVSRNSVIMAEEQPKIIKTLQEGIGGIRDVLLDGLQKVFLTIYHDSDYKLRKAYSSNIYIGGAPRFFIETIVMIVFAILALVIITSGPRFTPLVPILALFAIASQKLMPSVQNAYFAYTSIAGSKQVLGEIIEYLELPMPKDNNKFHRQKLPFKIRIDFKQIFFGYKKDSRLIFENLNLQINKGEKIGIIGKTGSGKSTLIDILIGLLKPAKGSVSIDGVKLTEENIPDWQMNIAHVPQVIFLSDSSIAENIAFGRTLDEIDYSNLENVIARAGLSDFVKTKKDGYKSLIGERGVRLSGGQRQRIGIARALYKGADLIIFDEATNALDSETENEIVSAIYALDKSITVIMIAHRLSTLKLCDKVFEIKNGGAVRKTIRNLR